MHQSPTNNLLTGFEQKLNDAGIASAIHLIWNTVFYTVHFVVNDAAIIFAVKNSLHLIVDSTTWRMSLGYWKETQKRVEKSSYPGGYRSSYSQQLCFKIVYPPLCREIPALGFKENVERGALRPEVG